MPGGGEPLSPRLASLVVALAACGGSATSQPDAPIAAGSADAMVPSADGAPDAPLAPSDAASPDAPAAVAADATPPAPDAAAPDAALPDAGIVVACSPIPLATPLVFGAIAVAPGAAGTWYAAGRSGEGVYKTTDAGK